VIWSQGIAGRAIFGDRTQNPTMAERFLLIKHQGARRAAAAIRTAVKRRRSSYRGNPALAAIGALGGLPSIGARYDKKKHPARVAYIAGLRDVALGTMKPWPGITKTTALTNLQAIAQGQEGFGVAIYAEIVQAARVALTQVEAEIETRTAAEEKITTKREAAAAAAAGREARYLEAGTSIGSALASAVGRRGSLSPRRRKRRRSYY